MRNSNDQPYKWIKIGGLVSLIPFILAIGPIIGYFIGGLLVKRLHFPDDTTAVLTAVGFVVSAREVIRIIKTAVKMEKELKG